MFVCLKRTACSALELSSMHSLVRMVSDHDAHVLKSNKALFAAKVRFFYDGQMKCKRSH
jgi:hypothetical protein